MATKYINGSYKVTNGYAVCISDDGCAIFCEKSELPDGCYDNDGPLDSELSKLLQSKFERPVLFLEASHSIEDYVKNILLKLGEITFLPISSTPKITKALSEGLDKIDETFAFVDTGKAVEYICSCARNKIAQAYPNAAYISPQKWYAGTVGANPLAKIGKFVMVITDNDKSYVSIIATINWRERLKVLNG